MTTATCIEAVAVLKDDLIVGHVPHNFASRLFHFLRRDVNKAFAEVTGARVNRGAGYGLEILCIYRLYGPPAYIERMKQLIDTLITAGHLLDIIITSLYWGARFDWGEPKQAPH